MPNTGSVSPRANCSAIPATGAASPITSLEAAAKLYVRLQWERSYVTSDKTFCVYLADSEAAILEHARLAGFPANKITEALVVIDPMTAFS